MMTLTITDDQKISSIQKSFTDFFPYLKIEFFKKLHGVGKISPQKSMINSEKSIGECRTIRCEGVILISPETTVSELEQKFGSIYGLSVQVFRKSGRMWIETTVTDNWTLAQQNKEGKFLSENSPNLEDIS